MEQDARRGYEYCCLPDNIRQIGEISGQRRIYIEDYVLTYIRKVFLDKQENSIVVFIGCEGKEEAANSLFIYGALEIPVDPESYDMQEAQWDMLYRLSAQYFPGGRIMGWGCGVSIWNSQVDHRVRKIQEEQFVEDSSILFLADLSEREEKVFLYSDQAFEELTGYFVYYERNPQMQEYMLREQPESDGFESDYEDEVTQSIRSVIQTKQSRQKRMHYLTYGMACVLLVMILAGGNLLIRSLAKINALEETIETLSEYVAESKQGDSPDLVISQGLGSGNATAAAAFPAIGNASAATDASPEPTPLSLQTASPLPVTVPAPEASPAAKKKKSRKQTSQVVVAGGIDRIKQSYIVRKGDTLSQIVWNQYHSLQYMDRVLRVNQIEDSDRIYEGQCILLPDV